MVMGMDKKTTKIVQAIIAIISAVYLLNLTAGFIEVVPDNLPLFGNLDEAGFTILLVETMRRLLK